MWGRKGVTWESGAELEDIHSTAEYGGHLQFSGNDEGALKLRRSAAAETGGNSFGLRIMEFAGGDVYEGELEAGLKHGQGTYKWGNGARYEGQWKDNAPSGMGKYTWPDGESYEGGFKYGRREGSGIYTFSDGASFVGVFADDQPRGKGVCTLPGGRCFHGDYALFEAYLRATRSLRGKKGKDPWIHDKWSESTDLLRNPPWAGFNAVRPGSRHYEEGFSVFKDRKLAPAVASRTFAIDWPHPLQNANALDLHTDRPVSRGRRRVPKHVLSEWPRIKQPPRGGDEDEISAVPEGDEEVWKVGDVCECEDIVGANMVSLGRPEIPGRLEPKPPGMYWKVRIDQVEHVWPGFTESNYPLIVCKVSYIGCSEKPQEWVQSRRLRPAKAVRVEGDPRWKGWAVHEKAGAVGEYKPEIFVPFDGLMQVGDHVECLFPFSGRKRVKEKARYLGDLNPPRMLDVAIKSSICVLMEDGDPSGKGMWECATPPMLESLPKLLCNAERWTELATRVLGSLSFMAQVNLELGPDALCAMLDEARVAMAQAGKAVPTEALQTVCMHREFAHMHRNRLRTVPLARIAKECALPCEEEANDYMLGQTGVVMTAETYMREAVPGETCDVELLEGAKRLVELCMRLGMLDTERMRACWEEASLFIEGNEPSQYSQAGQRREYRDRGIVNPNLKRKAVSSRLVCDALAKHFRATRPKIQALSVLRVLLDLRYDPLTNSTVRSRVICFLRSHPSLANGSLRALRVEMGHTRDCNCDWDTTEVLVTVSLPPGKDSRDACMQVVADFQATTVPFSTVCRTTYAMREISLLFESCFVSLVYASPAKLHEGDAVLGFTNRWRGIIQGGEEELEKVWHSQLLRQDVANALELPRENVRVVALGACRMRAIIELVCPLGQAPPDLVHKKAQDMVQRILKGESVFEGGRPVALYEYALSACLTKGHTPPSLPGDWRSVRVYNTVMGPDVHADGVCAANFALPTLRKVLQQARVALSWTTPGLSGIAQDTHVSASSRLSRMQDCFIPLAHGDRVQMNLTFLAERAGRASRALAWVVEGHDEFKVRVWAGDVKETMGQLRVQGWEHPEVIATVKVPLGEFSVDEFAAALENGLDGAHWSGGYIESASRSGASLPFKWNVVVDSEGRITIRLNAESFYRFELSFKSSTLAALVGFHDLRRKALRKDTGLVVTGSLPVRQGSPGVWICEAIASACWQQAEELQACASAGYKFCTKNPWALLGSSGLEVAEGCLLRPFGAEATIFVRSNSFTKGRHWDSAVADFQVPASAVVALIGDGSEAEELANKELIGAVRRYASNAVGCVYEHEGVFEEFDYPSHVTFSKYVILKKDVEARLKEWNDMRTKMRLEWKAEGRAEVVDERIVLEREEWFGAFRLGGDKERDIDALRLECFAWWTLLREEHKYMVKGNCFHSKNIELCGGQPCTAIKDAVVDKTMLDWEIEFAERRCSPARVCDRSAKGLVFDTDHLERSIVERACSSILAHVPLPDPTAPPLPSLPYNTHIIHRAAHSLASISLSEHYIAPYGGTRDAVYAQLERLTSGPPAARVPVVLLSGPPQSGRSSSLAHFHRTSQRCTAQRRLDHSVSAQPVFPNAGREARGAVWDMGNQPGVIICTFVGGGRSALREALEFAALEIAVQTKGPEALGAGQEETSKHIVGHLLSISEEELIEDARVKFSAEVTQALRAGVSVLILIDGLNNKEVDFFAKEIAHLHTTVASQLRRTNAHTEDTCVQCVLTCEGEISGSEGRLVEIKPLDDEERMLIARQRLSLYCCDDGDEDLGGVTCEEIARLVSDKEDAYLPLMIVACAHEAAKFLRDDENHRTFDSSGSIRHVDSVREHVLSLPQGVIPLLTLQVLPALEERFGYLTVMWVMLHLTLHPKGISLHDLRDHVRESLSSILLHVDYSAPHKQKYLLLIGSSEEPEFLVDAYTQDILWDHRRNGLKEFTTWYTLCRPPPGVMWCTDAELDGILAAISPFLRKGRPTQVPSFSSSEHDEVVGLHHEHLRAALVFRYDNPGSIRDVPEKEDENKSSGSPLEKSESLSIAEIRDVHDNLRVPLGTPAPTWVPSAKKLQMSGKALAVVSQGGKKKGLAKTGGGSELMGIGALEYEQSAMRGEDVATFFKSLDDNCVWHLHHLDQVLCLFPGGSMHVSRARFRPRIVKREILLGRFPVERDLLFLLGGRCRKDGTTLVAVDLARRGHKFVVKGVRDGLHLGEPCLFFAGDDFMNKSTGRFEFGDAEELDELSLQRANFSARTSDLSRDFEDGKVGGYGVCADLCLTGQEDNFVLSGGTGVVAWDAYDDFRIRMAHDPEDGQLFQYRKHKVFVRRRGMSSQQPIPTPSKISIPPRTRQELKKLATPVSIVDVDTGQELWRAAQPWFGVRVGSAYVLQVEGAARGRVRSLCDECNGTVNDPDAGESWPNVHFYYREDCDFAMHFLKSQGIGVREARGLYGRKVVSVLVKMQTQVRQSHWGGGDGMSAVLYPPRSETFLWTYSFDLNVKIDAWQGLAVSVDPLTGVCVCLEGQTAGRIALPRGSSLYMDLKDAKLSVGDYSCYGAFDGFMKNVAFYRRGFTVAEMQAMTKRGPPSNVLADDTSKEAIDMAKEASSEEKAAEKDEQAKPIDGYRELIQGHEPWGFWPLDEIEGIDCYDQAVRNESETADDVLSQLGVSRDKKSTQVSKDKNKKKVLVRNLVYESKHRGSVVKGRRGPKMVSAEEGGTSVQMQGGGIRSLEGSLCVEKKEEGAGDAQTKKVPTNWKDFTVEVWLQRVSQYFNANETIMSYNSETLPISGSMSWFFEETGKLNFRIEGEPRAVGPCPAVRIDDLNWHHLAVTRTSDEEEVNNWSFFVDGACVWSTRHDGVPVAQPLGTLLLGRRHGEHWGPSRMWRSGVGDPTCLQANICNFAFYPRALSADIIQRHFAFDPLENAVPAPKAPVVESSKAPGGGVLERVTDKVKGIISAQRSLLESAKPAGTAGFPSMSSVVAGAGKNPSREKIIIERSKFTALRHRPSVWGNVTKLSASDVDAFFGALEDNPIWSMTRRVTANASQQHNMQISEGSALGGTVTIRTLPNPSNKTPRSKIESAHALAADTLMISGDPSKSGTWDNASPSLLSSVVQHACMSRKWGDLERLACSLFFLGSCVREFGLVGVRKLLGEAVAALDESEDHGDDASSCRAILVVHYDFFQQYLIARSGEVNMRVLWEEAQKSRLPGVEVCIGMCGHIVDRCRHLLTTADLPSVIPIEITAYRLLRKLRKIKQLSLEFLCPDALGIDSILGEMDSWLSSRRDSFQSLAAKRFADLATYDDVLLAVDNASLLLRPFFDVSEVPDRVRVRLQSQIPRSRPGKEALACKLLRAAGSPHAIIVRMEEGLHADSLGTSDGQGIVVVACPSELLVDVASRLQALDEVQEADEVVSESCFVSLWIAQAGQWRGERKAKESLLFDLSNIKMQTPSLQNGRFSLHVVKVSEGGGFSCVELWGEGAWEAAEEICSQVRVEGSALMRGNTTRRISAAKAFQGFMPPGPAGEYAPANLFVSSALFDMSAERRHLGEVLFPAMQAVLRDFRVHMTFTDLRYGGPCQTFAQEHEGLSPHVMSLERSVVATPSHTLNTPWVLLLLGHHVGVRHPKDSPERLVLARTHPWTAHMQRSTAIALEVKRALPPAMEGAAPCVSSVLLRGARLMGHESFARLLPASARAAYGEASAEGAGAVSALREVAVRAGAVVYETKVLGYRCPVDVVVSRVRELRSLLEEDLRAMRGWPDLGEGERSAGEYRHRMSGLLRTRADEVSVRQRAVVADRKAELMRWWLLLREEDERTRGETGIGREGGREALSELRRIAREEAFVDLLRQGVGGGTRGILDGDGFVCPSVGSAGVAAQGAQLDMGPFSVAFARAFVARAVALFGVRDEGHVPLCATSAWAWARERQGRITQAFALGWMEPLTEVRRGQVLPAEGMTVVCKDDFAKGVGKIERTVESLGVQWVSGLKGLKKLFESELWAFNGERMPPKGFEPVQTICLAPIRTEQLVRMEQFSRAPPRRPLLLVQGAPCSGKSTLLACFARRKELAADVAQGIVLPRSASGNPRPDGTPKILSFHFSAGDGSSAADVMCYLAEDIEAQVVGAGAGWERVGSLVGTCTGRLQEARRRLACAVMRAACSKDGGASVLLVVDGLRGPDVESVCDCVHRIESELLEEVRRSMQRDVCIKLLVSCDTATRKMRVLVPDEQDVVRLQDLVQAEIRGLAGQDMCRFSRLAEPLPKDCLAVFAEKEGSKCPLYVSALAHASRYFKEEGSKGLVAMAERPDGIVKLFQEGILPRLEVLHGRLLVETLVLQLLACPQGVPYSQLKSIVCAGVKIAGGTTMKGRVAYADMEFEGVMEGLRPYLLPRRGDEDDFICLEHNVLRAAAQRRYDPSAAPIWEEEKEEDSEEVIARALEAKKKKLNEEDLDGYAWVRATVWQAPSDDLQVQVEYHVTSESALSVTNHAMFHIRKLLVPKEEQKKKMAAAQIVEVAKGTTLSRPGFVAKVPRGLGQAWPFVDEGFEEDATQRMLLSKAQHPDDASHMRAMLIRGFPPVPEKKYALTAHSAQSQVRAGARKQQKDRWSSTGGINPGPAFGTYPPKREARPNTVRMPTAVRSLAANWGQPLSAPAIPPGGMEAPLRGTGKFRVPQVPLASGDDRGALRRSASYTRRRQADMFGSSTRY